MIKNIELEKLLDITPVNIAEEKDVLNCYIGDLLSIVMSRAQEGDVWLTVQTNLNIIAVSVLRDLATVIVCEGIEIPEETVRKAEQQNVTLFKSRKTAYELAKKLSKLI